MSTFESRCFSSLTVSFMLLTCRGDKMTNLVRVKYNEKELRKRTHQYTTANEETNSTLLKYSFEVKIQSRCIFWDVNSGKQGLRKAILTCVPVRTFNDRNGPCRHLLLVFWTL